MGLRSLEDMGWPPGGDPTAPELPDIGDPVELGQAAGLPKGYKTFRARVTAVSSAGSELAYLAVDNDVTPRHRGYHTVRTAGIVIIEKAAAA